MTTYQFSIAEMKAIVARSNTEGYNEYGVPLHACHGYRHDAHYWNWIASTVKGCS
jgi:hypothetical protein